MKIRTLGTREFKQVLRLLQQSAVDPGVLRPFRQLYVPVHRISQTLPPGWQFVPAIYVAVEGGRVLGLIWLTRDGAFNGRWVIEQLVLDPEAASIDVGRQLVEFVIHRYGAEGVQTFLALVDQYCDDALALLKACGFRRVTRRHLVRLNLAEDPSISTTPPTLYGLRRAERYDAPRLKQLYLDALVPEVRPCLEKAPEDFVQPLAARAAERLRGVFFQRWVVEERQHLMACIELTMSAPFEEAQLLVTVSPAWVSHYSDAIRFGLAQAARWNRRATVQVAVFEFDKAEREQLEQLRFAPHATLEVLVKDYWIPLDKQPQRLPSPVLLLGGKTSHACTPMQPKGGRA